MATAEKSSTPIRRGEVYPLQLFLKMTGMGSRGLRDARENGLRVVYQGRTAYVSGTDFVDWIESPERTTERWGCVQGDRKTHE